MTEAKKQKLHSVESRAKVGQEASRSGMCATDPVSGIAALTDIAVSRSKQFDSDHSKAGCQSGR